MRPWPLRTNREKLCPRIREQSPRVLLGPAKIAHRLGERMSLDQNIFAGELALRIASSRGIPIFFDAIMKGENFGSLSERLAYFSLRPNIEYAFAVFGLPVLEQAVGVFRGIESAFRRSHIAPYIIKNVARD